jgi:cytochrome c-type biogenesis protein CcmH
MLLLGYIFFLPAILGKTGHYQLNRARLNVLLHQQRQQELAHETTTREDLDVLTAESERGLLGELETHQDKAIQASTTGRWVVVTGLSIVPILALVLYFGLGRPDLLGQPSPPNMADVEGSIRRLAERLQQQPNDLQGWILLARSLQATHQPDKAVKSYEYALKLAPDDLDIKAYYAEALAEASGGAFAGQPTAIVDEILQRNPNHNAALWIAGVAAAERKDATKAVEYWQRLKNQFAPASQEATQIEAYIAQVQGLDAPAQGSEIPASTAGKRLHVSVSLAKELVAKASPEDSLFIFARAAEGPPMPLVVVRKQVKDLPVEVVLDDSMAMMQGRNISAFDRIILGARVSKTGQPTPKAGDLQGLSEPLTPNHEARYAVVVNQIVGQ